MMDRGYKHQAPPFVHIYIEPQDDPPEVGPVVPSHHDALDEPRYRVNRIAKTVCTTANEINAMEVTQWNATQLRNRNCSANW